MQVLYITWCIPSRSYQDPYGLLSIGSTGRKNTVCLSVVQILQSKYQSRIDDEMQIDCTSDMINVLEEVARNNNIVLLSRINKIAS